MIRPKSSRKWTRAQRMKAMIAGEVIDFLPSQLDYVPYRLECVMKELGMTFQEFDDFSCNHIFHIFPLTESCYYSSGSEADEAMIKFAEEKGCISHSDDPTNVFDNFHVPWFKNKVGVHYSDIPIKDKNLDGFDWPDPNVSGIFDHLKDAMDDAKGEYYTLGLQHLTVQERSYLLIGYEEFMYNMAADPEFIDDLMDRIVDFHIGLAKRFVELGVDGVRTGDDFGTQLALQVSPKTWRRFFKPRLAKMWQVYKDAGITIFHHSCGNIEAIIPDLIEIGLEVLHPIQPLAMDINDIAKLYGDKLVFHGGIDTQQLLPNATPQQVKDATKNCIDVLGANGRYIIAPSQEIMLDVPTANIMAMIEAIKEYR